MVVFALGCCLFGFIIGGIIAACVATYVADARWILNTTEPMFIRHKGKLYKVIDTSVPKSWELANVRLKKQKNMELSR